MHSKHACARRVCRMRMGARWGREARRTEHVVQPGRVRLEGVGRREACVTVRVRVRVRVGVRVRVRVRVRVGVRA